jgi:tetratricopeptide (TPR) repeat protein
MSLISKAFAPDGIFGMDNQFARDRPNHPGFATDLNNLAELYRTEGRYSEAEPLYKRALTIGEKTLGPDDPDVATWLNNLALLYDHQGKYSEAEPLYRRALAIDEKALGPDHASFAKDLNNLVPCFLNTVTYNLLHG